METQNFCDLIGRDYQIILADPPWKYYGSSTKDQAAGKHYSCMGLDELAAFDVKSIAAKRCVLFCWSTSSQLSNAIELGKKWGFWYRGVFQAWVKTSRSGTIIHGQGVRPSFTKPTAEYLLVFSTEERGRTFPLLTERMNNVVLAARPGNVHSKKPDVFRDSIVQLLGDLRRVELFARDSAQGWDAWGDELATCRSCERDQE